MDICLICSKPFKKLSNHIRLKHGIAFDDYVNQYIRTPEIPDKPTKPSIDFNTRLDDIMDKLEKMFYIKLLTDVTGGKSSLETAISQLKGSPEGQKLLDAYRDGIEDRAEQEGGQTPTDILSVIGKAVGNEELMKTVGGIVQGFIAKAVRGGEQ